MRGLCANLKAYEEAELYFHAFSKSVLDREQTSVLHTGRFTPEVMCLKASLGCVTDIMYLTPELNHATVLLPPSVLCIHYMD